MHIFSGEKRVIFTLFILSLISLNAQASASPWERSVVTVEVNRKGYDYLQPWTTHLESSKKFGLVVSPREILTTAEYLNDRTLIRLQKGGQGKWYDAQVQWLDYHANLAVLSVSETNFWKGLQPAAWATPTPMKGSIQVVRWRNGILETRKGEINRAVVKRSKLSWLEYMQVEVDSEINGAGWAEAVVLGSKVIGLTSAQDGNNCTLIPSSFIRSILEVRKKNTYRGLGYFEFVWERAENPANLSYLKLPGEPRGVMVIDLMPAPGHSSLFKARDIILEIDGFSINTSGDYKDPDYGTLSLENLATRHVWAGDNVHFKIWRDGQLQEITYILPKADYKTELVPQAVYDQPPEYLLVGGLIFQPLTEPFLRTWGADWRRKAPFRLAYYEQDKPTLERPALVVLSMVLPDPSNLGYQDYRFQRVDRVNGQKISHVSDVAAALKNPIEGFHIVEFGLGESIHRLVLDAQQTELATRRVMQRYGIEKDAVIAQ